MTSRKASKSAVAALNLRLAAIDEEIESIWASNNSPFIKHAMFMSVLATRAAVVGQMQSLAA